MSKGSSVNGATTTKLPPKKQNSFTIWRWMEVLGGCLILFPALPFVVLQIFVCQVWEAIDVRTVNLLKLATKLNEATRPHVTWLVKHPDDAFVVLTTVWLAIILPFYFFYEFYIQTTQTTIQYDPGATRTVLQQQQQHDATHSFFWKRAFLYNFVRIGPAYVNFMYTYVLCHKEVHMYGKIFAYTGCGLGGIYNYWVGFFHGVLPGPFTLSHIHNHHKYDNDINDVYSTGSFRRDSFRSFLRYVWVWFLYALNVSTFFQFLKEGKQNMARKTIASTLLYVVPVAFFAYCSPYFALAYILYPLVEGNILLAMVNYTWHAFIDPRDSDNPYVNSTTILDGLNFTLAEEFHVVHHQYAGIHWTQYEDMYQKHYDEYIVSRGTLFYKCNLFQVWGMCTFGAYEALADLFVQLEPDPNKRLSKPELVELLKERLQAITWSYDEYPHRLDKKKKTR